MNIKRITFWSIFIIILALIVWGLAVAMKKDADTDGGPKLGTPPEATSTDHIIGAPDGRVTIIEYSDFQCPACEYYYPLVSKLLAENASTTRLVYRHFPLPQHANAVAAAMASEAAGRQGKFTEMYDRLFTDHIDWTELSNPRPIFIGYAENLGLNMEQFAKDLDNPDLKDRVNANRNEAISLGINSTPTFFINGKAIVNPQSYNEFQAIIEAAASSTPQ